VAVITDVDENELYAHAVGNWFMTKYGSEIGQNILPADLARLLPSEELSGDVKLFFEDLIELVWRSSRTSIQKQQQLLGRLMESFRWKPYWAIRMVAEKGMNLHAGDDYLQGSGRTPTRSALESSDFKEWSVLLHGMQIDIEEFVAIEISGLLGEEGWTEVTLRTMFEEDLIEFERWDDQELGKCHWCDRDDYSLVQLPWCRYVERIKQGGDFAIPEKDTSARCCWQCWDERMGRSDDELRQYEIAAAEIPMPGSFFG